MTEDNRQIDQRLSEKSQHTIAALTHRNAELEARNQTLISQQHTLKKKLGGLHPTAQRIDHRHDIAG